MKHRIFAPVWAIALAFWLSVGVSAREMLIPVGRVVGLTVDEGSVTVAAFDDVLGANAREAGIRIGDEILTANGAAIDSAQDLHRAVEGSDGTVELVLRRGTAEHLVRVSPVPTDQGPKLGLFLREGVTGIGTVTYYDPEEGSFGALGHGVSDSRGRLCAMRTGQVYSATVSGIRVGKVGAPGQLRGDVDGEQVLAALDANTPFGVFGNGAKWSGEPLPTAESGEVREGPACIMSNISADQVQLFQVEIVKLCADDPSNGRDLMLQVTDPALLEQTGGIVAGMSGSPIIQNGKLVGAVTHVLVNDPTRGYGIFIENMLDAAG